MHMTIISDSNKGCHESLPDARMRRRKFWELDISGKPAHIEIFGSGLEAVRFLLDRIYADPTISMDTTIGKKAMSGEELVGALLQIRKELIVEEAMQEVMADDVKELGWGMRMRAQVLSNEGYSKEQILEVLKFEYPDYIRADIASRKPQGVVWA